MNIVNSLIENYPGALITIAILSYFLYYIHIKNKSALDNADENIKTIAVKGFEFIMLVFLFMIYALVGLMILKYFLQHLIY